VKLNRCLVVAILTAGLAGLLPLTAADRSTVGISVTGDHIDFLAGNELVGRYQYAAASDAPLAKPYLWPLQGPGGVPMTRDWPMKKDSPGGSKDHPHQKSVWFCHGDVIPEGMEIKTRPKGVDGVDFWSEGKGHGRIVCRQQAEPKTTGNHGSIVTLNEWQTADGVKILDETRTIRLYMFGDTRLLAFDIDLQASVMPITFGDTKEGSFGIRINDRITEKSGNGKIENADGKTREKNCWGQLSAWCDYSGAINGKTVGLAILDHPRNRYPACWHSRDYGLMAANPFGRARSGFPAMKGRTDLVRLDKGEHLKLRYGLLIHPGDAKEGKVAEYFERFVKLD
jgi:Methane oxygenase PmoA